MSGICMRQCRVEMFLSSYCSTLLLVRPLRTDIKVDTKPRPYIGKETSGLLLSALLYLAGPMRLPNCLPTTQLRAAIFEAALHLLAP